MTGIHTSGVGAFGIAVRDRLCAANPTWTATTLEEAADAALHVVGMWRHDADLSAGLDSGARAGGAPWLPVVYSHPLLSVGPLVWEEGDACYGCYRRRRQQHGELRGEGLLAAATARDPALGVAGFLPHHAAISAAVASSFASTFIRGQVGDSVVWEMDVRDSSTALHAVLHTPMCASCARPQPTASDELRAIAAGLNR